MRQAWIALVVVATSPPAEAATLSLKGSDTMLNLGQRWAEAYMTAHRGATVQVTGGGTGTGIAALINGTADIAQASRPLNAKERKLIASRSPMLQEIPVALDGLAIFVHPANPIPWLTLAQLRAIYTGELRDWHALGGPRGPIVLYGRETSSGTYAFFKQYVLGKDEFAPRTQALPGTAAIVHAIRRDRGGIGYGGHGYAHGVKLVPIRQDDRSPAIMPDDAAVTSGRYPISRSLYWYTLGKPQGEIRRFIDFALSPRGQAIVHEVGYTPLKGPGK